MVEEREGFLVGLGEGRFVSGRHSCTTYIENLTFLYTSCLACIESVDLNALAKHSATESARRATWRQCHSRWAIRPHTFDNSGFAKLELVNQIGRLHAPARWARDSHGAHHLRAVFVDPPQPEQSRPLHWPRPARVDQTRACWGSLEIQEFQCE